MAVRWAGWGFCWARCRGPARVLGSHGHCCTGILGMAAGPRSPQLGGDLGSFFSQRAAVGSVGFRNRSDRRQKRAAGGRGELPCALRPVSPAAAGSAGSASSRACRSRPHCARCAACRSTPRRWTRLPTWRSSSRPTRRPAGAATRRYPPPNPPGPSRGGAVAGSGSTLPQRGTGLDCSAPPPQHHSLPAAWPHPPTSLPTPCCLAPGLPWSCG